MDRTRSYTEHNRVCWDQIAPARAPEPTEFFAAGGSTLDDCETEALPDVAGQRLLHLQCASGNESLSWAVRGAQVVGVDISAVAVRLATERAAQTELAARFVVADVYDLPAELVGFDVVYASSGVVCWLPSLDRWARTVAGRLRPGGRFLLYEHHPVWEATAGAPDALRPVADYFGRSTPVAGLDPTRRPRAAVPDRSFVSFLWPLGDVVTALARAGLRIELVVEHPVPELYGAGPAAARWPGTYLIRAMRS
ncbi:class I SAM-dependent methyltransferase [Actinocatenispora sera]|uniref:class I SAM-dependent methyltransferase n=1 Tax=Actinocatenispora sera TaxID=390989 RepID=UPI0033D936BD